MSSYLTSILTATKTRYATLRAGEDIDGETEDDSHITRVLRSYYTEQSRPFPPWLPAPPQPASRTASPVTVSIRNAYGSMRRDNSTGSVTTTSSSNAASLSDIWDAPPGEQPGRVGGGRMGGQQQHPAQDGRPRFGRQRAEAPPLFPDEGRETGGPKGTVDSAKRRIQERLWGGRNQAPSPPQQQHYAPPPQQPSQQEHYAPPQRGGRNDSGGGGGGGGGGYGGRSDGGNSGGYSAYSGGSNRQEQQRAYEPPRQERVEMPYVAAGMPWDDGAGGGYQQPAPQSSGGNLRRGTGGARPGVSTGGPSGGKYYR